MKVLLAPDSFKGSLPAQRVAQILADAAEAELQCETLCLPIADGGEGTLEAIVEAMGGEYVDADATGPLGDHICARYGLIHGGDTAIIEMARASGIMLANPLDPVRASSRGTGDLIAHAIARGARRLMIAIGGSATNDGGMGMLSALGGRFYDAEGRLLAGAGGELLRAARADLSALPKIDITIISDVTNPLLGPCGATYVYGPQKGADEAALAKLERGMENYASILGNRGDFPGAGAAGGVGYALCAVLGGRIKPGIDAVLDAIDFDARLEGVDLVVTGEGKLDGQTVRYGKAPAGVARRCAARGIPVIAVAGGLGEGAEAFYDIGLSSLLPILDGPRSLKSALENAEPLMKAAARRLFSTIKIGAALAK